MHLRMFENGRRTLQRWLVHEKLCANGRTFGRWLGNWRMCGNGMRTFQSWLLHWMMCVVEVVSELEDV